MAYFSVVFASLVFCVTGVPMKQATVQEMSPSLSQSFLQTVVCGAKDTTRKDIGYRLIGLTSGGTLRTFEFSEDMASFQERQSYPAPQGVFKLGCIADLFLTICIKYDGTTYNVDSHVLKWDGTSFKWDLYAYLGSSGCKSINGDVVGKNKALGVFTNYYDGTSYSINTRVFEIRTTDFAFLNVARTDTPYQSVATNGASGSVIFCKTNCYMILAELEGNSIRLFKLNSGTGFFEELTGSKISVDRPEELYKYDNYITSSAELDIMLAVIRGPSSTDSSFIDSLPIYRFDPTTETFSLYQTLASQNTPTSVVTFGKSSWGHANNLFIGSYLIVANQKDSIGNVNVNSPIYKLNPVSKQYDQYSSIATQGANMVSTYSPWRWTGGIFAVNNVASSVVRFYRFVFTTTPTFTRPRTRTVTYDVSPPKVSRSLSSELLTDESSETNLRSRTRSSLTPTIQRLSRSFSSSRSHTRSRTRFSLTKDLGHSFSTRSVYKLSNSISRSNSPLRTPSSTWTKRFTRSRSNDVTGRRTLSPSYQKRTLTSSFTRRTPTYLKKSMSPTRTHTRTRHTPTFSRSFRKQSTTVSLTLTKTHKSNTIDVTLFDPDTPTQTLVLKSKTLSREHSDTFRSNSKSEDKTRGTITKSKRTKSKSMAFSRNTQTPTYLKKSNSVTRTRPPRSKTKTWIASKITSSQTEKDKSISLSRTRPPKTKTKTWIASKVTSSQTGKDKSISLSRTRPPKTKTKTWIASKITSSQTGKDKSISLSRTRPPKTKTKTWIASKVTRSPSYLKKSSSSSRTRPPKTKTKTNEFSRFLYTRTRGKPTRSVSDLEGTVTRTHTQSNSKTFEGSLKPITKTPPKPRTITRTWDPSKFVTRTFVRPKTRSGSIDVSPRLLSASLKRKSLTVPRKKKTQSVSLEKSQVAAQTPTQKLKKKSRTHSATIAGKYFFITVVPADTPRIIFLGASSASTVTVNITPSGPSILGDITLSFTTSPENALTLTPSSLTWVTGNNATQSIILSSERFDLIVPQWVELVSVLSGPGSQEFISPTFYPKVLLDSLRNITCQPKPSRVIIGTTGAALECCIVPSLPTTGSNIVASFQENLTQSVWTFASGDSTTCRNYFFPALYDNVVPVNFFNVSNVGMIYPVQIATVPKCNITADPANVQVYVNDWFIISVSIGCNPLLNGGNVSVSFASTSVLVASNTFQSSATWLTTDDPSTIKLLNFTGLTEYSNRAVDLVTTGPSSSEFVPRTPILLNFLRNEITPLNTSIIFFNNVTGLVSFNVSRLPLGARSVTITADSVALGGVVQAQNLRWGSTSTVIQDMILTPLKVGTCKLTTSVSDYTSGYFVTGSVLITVLAGTPTTLPPSSTPPANTSAPNTTVSPSPKPTNGTNVTTSPVPSPTGSGNVTNVPVPTPAGNGTTSPVTRAPNSTTTPNRNRTSKTRTLRLGTKSKRFNVTRTKLLSHTISLSPTRTLSIENDKNVTLTSVIPRKRNRTVTRKFKNKTATKTKYARKRNMTKTQVLILNGTVRVVGENVIEGTLLEDPEASRAEIILRLAGDRWNSSTIQSKKFLLTAMTILKDYGLRNSLKTIAATSEVTTANDDTDLVIRFGYDENYFANSDEQYICFCVLAPYTQGKLEPVRGTSTTFQVTHPLVPSEAMEMAAQMGMGAAAFLSVLNPAGGQTLQLVAVLTSSPCMATSIRKIAHHVMWIRAPLYAIGGELLGESGDPHAFNANIVVWNVIMISGTAGIHALVSAIFVKTSGRRFEDIFSELRFPNYSMRFLYIFMQSSTVAALVDLKERKAGIGALICDVISLFVFPLLITVLAVRITRRRRAMWKDWALDPTNRWLNLFMFRGMWWPEEVQQREGWVYDHLIRDQRWWFVAHLGFLHLVSLFVALIPVGPMCVAQSAIVCGLFVGCGVMYFLKLPERSISINYCKGVSAFSIAILVLIQTVGNKSTWIVTAASSCVMLIGVALMVECGVVGYCSYLEYKRIKALEDQKKQKHNSMQGDEVVEELAQEMAGHAMLAYMNRGPLRYRFHVWLAFTTKRQELKEKKELKKIIATIADEPVKKKVELPKKGALSEKLSGGFTPVEIEMTTKPGTKGSRRRFVDSDDDEVYDGLSKKPVSAPILQLAPPRRRGLAPPTLSTDNAVDPPRRGVAPILSAEDIPNRSPRSSSRAPAPKSNGKGIVPPTRKVMKTFDL